MAFVHLACIVLVAFTVSGCGPRAPQINFANRVYSGALRTATNTKNAERLAKAKKIIDRDHTAGTIGPEEYAFYGEIISLAEAGRWTEAEQLAIRFRRDQTY
jgi:hypothetical protein